MARKKAAYDAACNYNGKLMGRCTVADSNSYVAMMETCGGSAVRVMQEYTYFSPELKSILEKVAAIQAKQNRTDKITSANLFTMPIQSPWGKVQTCDALCPGVFLVSTASHGGTMVSNEVADLLSSAARKCSFKQGGYFCFEEDCQESVALRELLDKKLWGVPDRIKDKVAFEENINQSIRQYNPDYWRVRQQGVEKAQIRQEQAPAHCEER